MNAQVSEFAWWKSALENPKSIGSADLPVHEDTPQVGYYRMKKGKGERGWLPIAILSGGQTAAVGKWNDNDRRDAGTVWTWCCRNPIAYDVWRSVAVDGAEFPDSIESLITKVNSLGEISTSGANSDAYAFWRAAISGKRVDFDKERPPAGFWRMKRFSEWVGVATWYDGDFFIVQIDGKASSYEFPAAAGENIAGAFPNPVTREVFNTWIETGQWPEDVGLIGDNSGEDASDIMAELSEAFSEAYGKAKSEIQRMGKPKPEIWNDDWAVKKDRIANYVNAISSIEKRAISAFEDEKRPHLEAGRAVDSRWRKIRNDISEAIKSLKATTGEFLKAQREYETEKKRREMEKARVDVPSFDAPAEALPEPVKVKAGTSGRSVSLVTVKRARITDPIAFATHLLTQPSGPNTDIMEVMKTIANRLAPHLLAGLIESVPGVEAYTEEVPR